MDSSDVKSREDLSHCVSAGSGMTDLVGCRMLCKSVSSCTAIHWNPQNRCTLYSCREEVKLEVKGVGTASLRRGQDPADLVEEFAAKATQSGHNFNVETMKDMMKYFCTHVPCSRPIVSSIRLKVNGIGRLEVLPFEEPAAVVERFSVHAFEKGHGINIDNMKEMLAFFCERRSCHRGIRSTLKLEVGSVGTLYSLKSHTHESHSNTTHSQIQAHF